MNKQDQKEESNKSQNNYRVYGSLILLICIIIACFILFYKGRSKEVLGSTDSGLDEIMHEIYF